MTTPDGTMEGETRDVSTLGAFIHCQDPLDPTESFLLNVQLPTGSPLQVFATVVWSNNSNPEEKTTPRGMGVRFIW
jgi:hypothetical protein